MVSPQSAAAGHGNPVTPQKRGYCDANFKRLEAGTFLLPSTTRDEQGVELDERQLNRLLTGLDLRTGRRRKRFRRVG
jgi:hypothetical protein